MEKPASQAFIAGAGQVKGAGPPRACPKLAGRGSMSRLTAGNKTKAQLIYNMLGANYKGGRDK